MKKLFLIPVIFIMILSLATATELNYLEDHRVYEYNFYQQYATQVTGLDWRTGSNSFGTIVADYSHGTNRGYTYGDPETTITFRTNANLGLSAKKMINADTSDFYYFYSNRIIINTNNELAYYYDETGNYGERCNWGQAISGEHTDITIADHEGNDYLYIYNSQTDIIQKTIINASTCTISVANTYLMPIDVTGSDFAVYNNTFFILNTNANEIYHVDGNNVLRETYTHNLLEHATSIAVSGTKLYVGLSEGTPTSTQYIVASFTQPTDLIVNEVPYTYANNEWYSDTQCIYDGLNDNWFLCENTDIYVESNGLYDELIFQCDYNMNENLTRCGDTCTEKTTYDTEFNINYISGECDYTPCSEETETCAFDGQSFCLNSNTFQDCGQYDLDPCLEWSSPTQCLPNQLCSIGRCIDIDFSEYGTTLNVPTLIVTEKIEDDPSITYNYNTLGVLGISTAYNGHNQVWNILTNPPDIHLYGNVDCDYDELIYLDYRAETLNDEFPPFVNTTSLALETIVNNGEIGVKFKGLETISSTPVAGLVLADFEIMTKDHNKNNNINIVFGSSEFNYLTIIIEHNKDTNEYSFYKTEINPSNLLYTLDSYVGDGQDTNLKQIHTTATFNIQIGQVDLFTSAYYDDGVIIYTQEFQSIPFDQEHSLNNYLSQISFSATEDTYLSHLKIYKPDEYPPIRDITGMDNELFCSYPTSGCRDVRFYAMANEVPLFNNYVEKRICINELGVVPVGTETEADSKEGIIGWLQNRSTGEQLLIVIGSILGTFLIFTIGGTNTRSGSNGNGVFIGSDTGLSPDHTSSLAKIFAVFVPLGLIIFFAVTGIIPEWIIILMVVLTAGFVALFFRRQVIGGN